MSQSPSIPNEQCYQNRVSILDRYILVVLGPPEASWKLRLRLGDLCLWWPALDISLISLDVQYPQVSVQIESEYEITTRPSCFIFSPKALSCFIGWGTQMAD